MFCSFPISHIFFFLPKPYVEDGRRYLKVAEFRTNQVSEHDLVVLVVVFVAPVALVVLVALVST